MTEEKKDNPNEQQTFLSEHEDLLNSIKKEEKPADEQVEAAVETPAESDSPEKEPVVTEEEPVIEETPEAVEETPAVAAEEAPADDEAPAEEAVPEEEPVIEDTTVEEEPEEEAEPVEEAPADEEPEPEEEPEPVEAPVEKPVPAAAAVEKKAAQQSRHSPQHEEVLRKQALEQSEVKEVLVFFRKYAKPAAIVIIAVCAFILVDKFLKSQRYKKEATADTALINAQGISDLQEIVDKYKGTPAGPIALMELAREQFNLGQFDEAEALYVRFTKEYGKHELADQARLNLITCIEAKEQFDEAGKLYATFAEDHEGSRLAPSALLGQARCLEALGRLDEAQTAYEDMIVNFQGTAWSRIAEVNLKTVLSQKQ